METTDTSSTATAPSPTPPITVPGTPSGPYVPSAPATPPAAPTPTPDPATRPTVDPATIPMPTPAPVPSSGASADAGDATFDDILTIGAARRERVPIASLGGKAIYVQSVLHEANEAIEAQTVSVDADGETVIDTSRYKGSRVMAGWVTAAGERVFQGDIGRAKLAKLRAEVVDEVFDHVQRLSGARKGDTERLGKSSSAGPSGANS